MSDCHRMRQRPQYRPQMQMLWKGPRQRTLIATAATSASHENDDSSSSSSASSSPHASVGSAPTGDVKATPREPGAYEKFVQDTLRYLAELSLKDYQWRADIFKAKEAERMMEQSLARVRGNDPNYVRPMDADDQTIGPLGRWEKSSVDWLFQVIEEEARRAEQIVQSAGKLIRPKDAGDEYSLGPLGFLEKRASDFIRSIQIAEKERVRSNILRPKDLDESLRGPLGEAEWQAIQVFQAIEESEKLRLNQSRLRGGELVRPIDVPGPLGEFEMAVLDVFDSEQKRAKERQQGSGVLVRPKDARIPGRLGEYEKQAVEAIKKLNDEEKNAWRAFVAFFEKIGQWNMTKVPFWGWLKQSLSALSELLSCWLVLSRELWNYLQVRN